jgi:hypothetical protein
MYIIKKCDRSVETRALEEKSCLIISNIVDSNKIYSVVYEGAYAELQTSWFAGARNA